MEKCLLIIDYFVYLEYRYFYLNGKEIELGQMLILVEHHSYISFVFFFPCCAIVGIISIALVSTL